MPAEILDEKSQTTLFLQDNCKTGIDDVMRDVNLTEAQEKFRLEGHYTITVTKEKKKLKIGVRDYAKCIISKVVKWFSTINRTLTLIQQGKLTPNQTTID